MVPCNSKHVVNRAVDREKSLNLCRRFEATHLAFLLRGVLVGIDNRDFMAQVEAMAGDV